MIVYLIFCKYYTYWNGFSIVPIEYLHMVSLDEKLAYEYSTQHSDENCTLFVKELWVNEIREDIGYAEYREPVVYC